MVGCFKVAVWITGFCIAFLLSTAAHAQQAKQQVIVGGATYLVDGTAVSHKNVDKRPDDITIQKAILTARVVDELILNSEFAAELFSAATRASVFADHASGRLVEPWRWPLLTDRPLPEAFIAAKDRYKEWATRLADDPRKAVLAIARRDYLDGIEAYRENAAIYRKVTKNKAILSYQDARQFLQNQMPITRLAYARRLEEQTAQAASGGSDAAKINQGNTNRFKRLVQEQVVSRIDTDIKSAQDLDASDGKIRRIAEARFAGLRSYRDAVTPTTVTFNFGARAGGGQGAASPNPGSAAQTFAGQNKVTFTVPAPPPKSAAPFDMTGGIFLPPAATDNPPGAAAAAPSSSNAAGGGNRAGRAGGTGSDAGAGNAVSGFGQARDWAEFYMGRAPTNNEPGPTNRRRGAAEPYYTGSAENLKVYSSKPYHDNSGWIFNPRTGMWQNPNDPADMMIPAVIICCDETGLAFPGDAVEAKESFLWGDGSGGGTDPNCGRLYTCGPGGGGTAPGPTVVVPVTDKDDEIRRAIVFLDQLPPDQKGPAFVKFIESLPKKYRDRAIELLHEYNAGRSGANRQADASQRAIRTPRPGSRRASPNRQSTITGLGGVSAQYQPITQKSARAIVGKYKSIPGGVTLEGDSPDFAFVNSVRFLPKANAFILNDDVVYANPVTTEDLAQINDSLAEEDKLGVSLGGKGIVYGKLAPDGTVAWKLKVADKFLGAIAVNQRAYIADYKMAPGYNSVMDASPSLAVYFNIHGARFSQEPSGEIRRSQIMISFTLVPLATKGATLHQPDMERIARGNVEPHTSARLRHLQENFGYYGRERIVRQALAYGEAAVFVRSLKAKRIRLDLN